jgi:hypothetical protein
VAKLTTQGNTVGFRILLYETLVIMCGNVYYLPLSTCAPGYRDKKENTLSTSVMSDKKHAHLKSFSASLQVVRSVVGLLQ